MKTAMKSTLQALAVWVAVAAAALALVADYGDQTPGSTLTLLDVEKGKVERAIATNQDVSHMVAVSPDLKLAFTANTGSGSTTMVDLVEGVALASVKTGAASSPASPPTPRRSAS